MTSKIRRRAKSVFQATFVVVVTALIVSSMVSMPLSMVVIEEQDKSTVELGGVQGSDNTPESELNLAQSTEDNGTVYIGSNDGNVYALDENTGSEKWVFQTGNEVESSPTVIYNTVYILSWDGNFYAIDADTGEEKWNSSVNAGSMSSPVIIDKTVYFGNWDGYIYALDAETGEEEWKYNTEGGMIDHAVTYHDGKIYAGDYDGVIHSVDADTGDKEWEYTTGDVIYGSPTASDGKVFIGSSDDNMYSLNASNGDLNWNYSTGANVETSPVISGGEVFFGSNDNYLYSINISNGGLEWRFSTDGAVRSSPTIKDGSVYFGSFDQNLYRVDLASRSEVWGFNTGAKVYSSPTVKNGKVYVASTNSQLRAIDTSTGDEVWSKSKGRVFQSSFTYVEAGGSMSSGSRVRDQSLGYHGNSTLEQEPLGNQVVVDQDGNPVPDATVEYLELSEENFTESDVADIWEEVETYEEMIDEMGSIPERYEDFKGEFGDGNSVDVDKLIEDDWYETVYPLVHTQDDWNLQSSALITDSNIDEPRLQIPRGEPVTISLWNPTEGGFIGDQVENSFPGRTTKGKIEIIQLDPDSVQWDLNIIDTKTYEPEVIAKTSGANPFSMNKKYGVTTHLPPGLYQAYPEEEPAARYTFTVGSPREITSNFVGDLEDEAGELTERAKKIESLIDNDIINRGRAVTNSSGAFEIDSDADHILATAYKADSDILNVLGDIKEGNVSDPTLADISLNDLREYQDIFEYNGSFYLPTETERFSPEDENVKIETLRAGDVPWGNLSRFDSIQDLMDQIRLDDQIDPCQNYCDEVEDWTREQLEEFYEKNLRIIRAIPGAEELYLELSGYSEIRDASDLTVAELREQSGVLEEAINMADEDDDQPGPQPPDYPDDPEDGPWDITDGLLSGEIPIPGVIDTDSVSAEIWWSNGSIETMPEEYWEIEQGVIPGLSTPTLVVKDYPINETDPAQFRVRIRGGSDRGEYEDIVPGIPNPSWTGTAPDVRAIDLNTLGPGPTEEIRMDFRPGENGFEKVIDVTAYGPNGDEIGGNVADSTASFTPQGEGTYTVKATVEDRTGEPFVYRFPVKAYEDPMDFPPTVRGVRAFGGDIYAVVGEGLRDAEIKYQEGDSSKLSIAAITPSGSTPGSIDVHADDVTEGTVNSIDVSVLEGSEERTINSHIEVVVHLGSDFGGGEGAAWRGDPGLFGQPLTWGEATRYGEIVDRSTEDGEKTIIRTYTEADGSVTVTANSDPGLYQSARHWLATVLPRFSWLPIGALVPTGLGSLLAGLAGAVLYRRFGPPTILR